MKKQSRKPVKKIPVNSKLPEDVLQRWHLFAVANRLNKEQALAELINRGSKV